MLYVRYYNEMSSLNEKKKTHKAYKEIKKYGPFEGK